MLGASLSPHAGKWGAYPATLGMGLCTFDILAQIISHPLVDDAMIWTTRWRTGPPQSTQMAGNYDALQARTSLTISGYTFDGVPHRGYWP